MQYQHYLQIYVMNQQKQPTQIQVHTLPLYKTNSVFYFIENKIQPFLSKNIPSISISNYLNRLAKYTSIEYSTLETMLILIDRFCNKTQIILNYFNIHK